MGQQLPEQSFSSSYIHTFQQYKKGGDMRGKRAERSRLRSGIDLGLIISFIFLCAYVLSACNSGNSTAENGITSQITGSDPILVPQQHTDQPTPTPTPTPSVTPTTNTKHTQHIPQAGLLCWVCLGGVGASSYLFGTNDTQEWANNNVETNPSIQLALKNAHFTLMRTFFFDKSLADGHTTTMAEVEQRLKTLENSGMTCLGVLHSITNLAFDESVVRYAGSRCLIYEFGNESDLGDNHPSISTYLQQWNAIIPQLRRINPQAKFIGPVTYNDTGNDCHYDINGAHCYMQDFLTGVKKSGVLPDAVSFHWYPCYNDTKDSCLAKASSYAQVTAEVKGWVKDILGKDLPVGITEWNYDPGNPPPDYGQDFIQQFSIAAIHYMIQAKLDFANQFDALSYSGYGSLDMFDVVTSQPKPQYFTLKSIISQYVP